MKKQTQHNICWSQVGILATVLIFSMLNVVMAEAGERKFIDPKSEFGKVAGIVTQLDGSGFAGHGTVIGKGGCYVLANVHVAFGESRDAEGATVLMENASAGHVLRFQFDFDSKSKRFKREAKATVVEFLTYDPHTRRGRTKDVAILKLDNCLGPDFGKIRFDQDADKKRFPTGKLLTVSIGLLNGVLGVIAEECEADQYASITGLITSNCHSEDMSSGRMYLEKSQDDGNYRLIGIHQGRETMQDGRDVPVAVYARAFNPIVAKVLGEESPVAIGPVAGDRAPQNDQTALLAPAKARTVVR